MVAVAKRDTEQGVGTEEQTSANGRLKKGGWLFRYSRLDALLFLIAVLHVAGLVATAVWFESLPVPALVLIGCVFMALCSTNYQCVAHNFIHNPFFSREGLNHTFAVMNSILLGMPQTLYRFHHLNHHKYNSDYRDPESGQTKDYSSLYRFSRKPDEAENIWAYSFLGPFRMDFGILFGVAREKGLAWLVWIETFAFFAFYAGLAIYNWYAFLVFFVPVLFLGQVAALAENYLEHKGANPTSRLTDSVSCYSAFYNFIWFNNGYHQEHHFRPYVHWAEIRELKSRMLPESERRVVRGSHLSNLF